tara:strand:- start:249 stop:398 length:150 start_codon:yes stop_codon:yes gene_type:complete
VFNRAQKMLFDKFDDSSGRVFNCHVQLLGHVNIDSFSRSIEVKVQGAAS